MYVSLYDFNLTVDVCEVSQVQCISCINLLTLVDHVDAFVSKL